MTNNESNNKTNNELNNQLKNEVNNEITQPDYINLIQNYLNLSIKQITNTLNLIEEGATVPFIARYRKEITNNLDEKEIRNIIEYKEKQENLFKAKKTAINNIYDQNKLTKKLKEEILNANTLTQVEDIYAPYKRKKKTKAQIAIENGFMPIAEQIKNQEDINIPNKLLEKHSKEEIIQGACDIITQEIADDTKNREGIRNFFLKYGEIESKHKNKLDELPQNIQKQIHKFEIYQNFNQDVSKIKAYQTLALNRGEKLNILNVKLVKDTLPIETLEEKYITKKQNQELLKLSIKEAFNKIFKSIETQNRNLLTQNAELESIRTFQSNLKNLLLTKPEYNKQILGIDPGFRTGCKLAVINKEMMPIEFSKVYIEKKDHLIREISNLIDKYKIDVVAIGNGTGSNQIKEILENSNIKQKCEIEIINEDGASVYSASEIAQEEFPKLDLTDRGTISIARRYIDPLAELVKIPVGSIGVGMYQHDMNQKELEKKLGYVVEDVVNAVGINVNTAGVHILKFISGLNLRSAKKIVKNKPYKSRTDLKKILTPKAFQQATGFLRIIDSKEELDNTNIHPEQYKLAKHIIKNNIKTFSNDLKNYYKDCNETTVIDILKAYENIGQDIRQNTGKLKIKENLKIEDLEKEQILTGIVRNVMQFGAFVDIGVKQNGLVHISQLADKFVKDPLDIVEVGDQVKVRVLSVDVEKGKIQLSMKGIE